MTKLTNRTNKESTTLTALHANLAPLFATGCSNDRNNIEKAWIAVESFDTLVFSVP